MKTTENNLVIMNQAELSNDVVLKLIQEHLKKTTGNNNITIYSSDVHAVTSKPGSILDHLIVRWKREYT